MSLIGGEGVPMSRVDFMSYEEKGPLLTASSYLHGCKCLERVRDSPASHPSAPSLHLEIPFKRHGLIYDAEGMYYILGLVPSTFQFYD